ncbi:uncharacterized protein LOC124932493 [Impatiens glandulifera]|uniref:uncharacterized protein LOC124932493 n=1 Tax=Impatiens glandulifera TaxID=253017 RepID=UPI001FB0AE12|nr:uncharacterized protein LOC124932493 [Impatiens glandulifera]
MPKKYHEHKDGDEGLSMSCYLHPKQVLEGVCPLCLNERLLVLFSANKKGKEEQINDNPSPNTKIFDLGSILNRFELKPKQETKNLKTHIDRSPTPEDSFISIRFGDNGVGSWEKNNPTSKMLSLDHVKPRSTMRWQKQICRLFRLAKWKRPDKDICHAEKTMEGIVKGRNLTFRASV